MRTRTALPTTLAITALLLAGCGDDKPKDGSGAADADTSVKLDETPSEDSETPTSDEPMVEPASGEPADVLKTLLQAYYDNDADTACSLQTERYTKEAIADGIKEEYVENGATCADLVAAASALYKAFGVDPSEGTYKGISNDGKTAKVRFTSDDSPQTYVLVNTDGDWLLDKELD